MRRACLAALALAAGAALTGCVTGSDHEPGSVYQLEPIPDDTPKASMSFAVFFSSLDELLERATVVVTGRPIGQSLTDVSGLTHTVTTFRVEQVLYGDPGLRAVRVRNLGPIGAYNTVTPSLPTIPIEGLEYILMLEPFILDHGPTGDYLVSGPAQWVRQYSDQRFALDVHEHGLLNRQHHNIPLDTDITEIRSAIQHHLAQ